MPYTIEWRKYGAVKNFTGTVSFDDVLRSEREITSSPDFMNFWYVVSNFLNARHPGISDSERLEVRTLRLGGSYSNPRMKFACVTDDPKVRHAIQKSVFEGQSLYATHVFQKLEDAMEWATVS